MSLKLTTLSQARAVPGFAARASVGASQSAVACAFAVPITEIRAPLRCKAATARARQAAIYLTRVGFELSYGDIGAAFGRDRTTAAHACRVVEDRRDDAAFDQSLSALEKGLSAWWTTYGVHR